LLGASITEFVMSHFSSDVTDCYHKIVAKVHQFPLFVVMRALQSQHTCALVLKVFAKICGNFDQVFYVYDPISVLVGHEVPILISRSAAEPRLV
jgi:hypothetical protein